MVLETLEEVGACRLGLNLISLHHIFILIGCFGFLRSGGGGGGGSRPNRFSILFYNLC